MARVLTALALLALTNSAVACGNDHAHAHDPPTRRGYPPVPVAPPARPLQWGDINVIHTTDSHGWLLGHTKSSFPEPNYSGDLGDFASFVKHMKDMAQHRDVDLLLIDSGDLHDGTGLSDGGPPGAIDAHNSTEFFAKLPYDILAIGNHELYVYNNTLDMYKNFAPKYNGRYLSSNVNITVPNPHGQGNISVPVGSRYAKFNTAKGRKVTSLGVIFDFTGNDDGTTVQTVEDMVNETWFKEAIKDAPDLFVLAGHMPVSNDNWPTVHSAIRAVHPDTPIMIFGGHTHIRDCVQYDGRTMALESGRYMETVGWMSMNMPAKHAAPAANLTFSRRYLDPNRVTYEYHSSTSNETFDTPLGKTVTQGLQTVAQAYNLSQVYGTAPHDYYLNRVPYPDNESLLSLFAQNVTPVAFAVNNTRASIPHLIIVNSGALRVDLYTGPFTRNDAFEVTRWTDGFRYIAGVPASVAAQVLPLLNQESSDKKRSVDGDLEAERYARGWVGARYNNWLQRMDATQGVLKRAASNLTLGYVTQDSCPGVGDDTLHAPLPYYSIPDYAASSMPAVADSALIDLVFVDFIGTDAVRLLNQVQNATTFVDADVKSYSDLLIYEVLSLYAQIAWN